MKLLCESGLVYGEFLYGGLMSEFYSIRSSHRKTMVCRTHLRTSHVEDYKIRVKKKNIDDLGNNIENHVKREIYLYIIPYLSS